MANNWYGQFVDLMGNSTPSDPSKFDYDTAAQKVKRQRAAAQALQDFGAQQNQGQLIKNGDFIGFAGGNTLGSTLARLASAALSVPANDAADNAQKQLGVDSQNAMAWALDPNNSVAAQRAAQEQMQREADQEAQRETDHMTRSVHGGEILNANTLDDPTIQTQPVYLTGTDDITALPMPKMDTKAVKAAAKAIASPASATPSASIGTNHSAQSVVGGPQSFGTGADLSRALGPKTSLPTGASGALSPDEIGFASKMLGGDAASAPVTEPAAQVKPMLPQVAATPAIPGIRPVSEQSPSNALATQVAAPDTDPAAMLANASKATTVEGRARALGIDPTAPRGPGDPSLADQVNSVFGALTGVAGGVEPQRDERSLVQQARDQANSKASFADQMASLQQLSRTGPMGQQLAQSMTQAQFSKDWGEVKNADGATIGVYNKRNPSEVMNFKGTNAGTKVMDAAMSLVKNTDPSNAAAMQRLNENLTALGQPPMTPEQVSGMQLSASDRTDKIVGLNKAQGEIANDIVSSKNNIISMQKAMDDAQKIVALSARVGSKYPGIATIDQLISRYGKSDPDIQELQQLYSQNTLEVARNALQGQGRLNQSEFDVFAKSTPNMQTNPAAVARLMAPMIGLLNNKMSVESAIQNERLNRYKSLGGDPSRFAQADSSGDQQSQQGAAPTRTAGNYRF